MAQKIKNEYVLFVILLLLIGCNHKSDILYFYQFQDRTDCEYCFPAYCFFYDSAFHYTAIKYGFYENDSGFLRDSIFFTSLRDSIEATIIRPTHNCEYFDSIECYCEYPSLWRFTFEMTVSKQGNCKLLLHSPHFKKGQYFFELTPHEHRLVNYSALLLLAKNPGLFMTFDKWPHIPGDPIYFEIKIHQGSKDFSYIGYQDADDVPDELFFFRDAMGAIAQNHFSRQPPIPNLSDQMNP